MMASIARTSTRTGAPVRWALCVLALLVAGCSSSAGGLPANENGVRSGAPQIRSLQESKPTLATYYFYCSDIGLGTITAVVVANSQDDAFHVTSVGGGNGTVSPGDMLLVIDYTPGDKYQSHNPGFDKNGQTTYTCPSYSGRRQLFGTVTFVVRGSHT